MLIYISLHRRQLIIVVRVINLVRPSVYTFLPNFPHELCLETHSRRYYTTRPLNSSKQVSNKKHLSTMRPKNFLSASLTCRNVYSAAALGKNLFSLRTSIHTRMLHIGITLGNARETWSTKQILANVVRRDCSVKKLNSSESIAFQNHR